MPLNWNEIHIRAIRFAQDWQTAHYEKGQSQTFYNEFFNVFGRRQRDVAVYEQKVKKLNNKYGFIDLFWPGHLLVEQKSAGHSLTEARDQAFDYFLGLKELEKPRYILLSDFQTFEMIDLETRTEYHFTLAELPEKIKLFDFIAGYTLQQYKDQDPVNIQAASLMSRLHKQLKQSGYALDRLERFLVRIMFCLFADDTGIFEPDAFLRYIEDSTRVDGRDVGERIGHLFDILDTPINARQTTLTNDLTDFPYVNGELFSDTLRMPSFNQEMRETLLSCCYFNWSKVSPALFGSLFQAVMLPEEQRKGGAHYTSELNILKTVHPLFLDELRHELAHIADNRGTKRQSLLEKFHNKLGTLTFFDPACGCGNFLILAYRELRQLEIETLENIYPLKKRNQVLDIALLSKVNVDQFYGIEIEEFPVRIAKTAMWLVDHQMNMKLSEVFGQVFSRLPLTTSARILHGNALQLDWKNVIAPDKLKYILGNPPFVGKHLMSKAQKEDTTNVFANLRGGGDLDYVTAWYYKATQYIQDTKIKVAFVSTNSITQGEQVTILWKLLFSKYKIKIQFAHRTFKWTIDEKKAGDMKIAAVHVVIIGFAAQEKPPKYLFEYETPISIAHRIEVKNISPYLLEGDDFVVDTHSEPICDVPKMLFGSKPVDEGNFIFTDEQKSLFLAQEPKAASLIYPLLSAEEYLNGKNRWCLWLVDVDPKLLRSLPKVMERVENVKKFRLASKKEATKKAADFPTTFMEIRQPTSAFILVPIHSSEERKYVPLSYFEQNSDQKYIVHNSCICVPNGSLYHFGILSSLMHMAWMRIVCGRIKSDFRYSVGIVYNGFSWPEVTPAQVISIETKAKALLEARQHFPDNSLADLYNENSMPPLLRKAHQALDKAVDQAYREAAFDNERGRVEFLFERYKQITEPLLKAMLPPTRRRRNTL